MQKGRKQEKRNDTKQLSNSQNFITDRKLLHRLVQLGGIGKSDTIFEIGTGKGHLTETLCQKGGFVYSIEIDAKLADYARTKLSHLSNIKLICGDFLKYSLPAKGNYKVFANIPYFITTQIMEKLTNTMNPPTDIWLIMEKGAAKRFMGIPRENEKSLLLKVNWDM
ncbi:MAG: rRNA adenine N(6)-methyltransferase family protein, partial [Lachnospiraceae bacterium]|nr:rRNA adenine N(6)-methyltransferase family protein [Lachnospiraceae bacterium]